MTRPISQPWPWRGALLPLAVLVLLESALRIADLRSDSIARPSEVLRALLAGLLDASVLRDTVQTLGCALGGLLIGAAMGLVLGALLGLSRIAAGLAWAPVESMRHLPPVALLPIATMVFGQGVRMEVSVVAFTCFWPVLLLSQAAVAGVEPRLLEVARTLRMGSVATIVKIVLPASAARVAVALRLSAGIALIVAVTTEIAANPLGIGYAMVRSQAELQPAPMYGYLIWLALLGWALNEAMGRLERRVAWGLGAAGRS